MVAFTFAMRRHLIRFASPFISFRLTRCVWVSFADHGVQRLTATGPILTCSACVPEFVKFWDNVGDPWYLPIIVYVTFRLEDIRH